VNELVNESKAVVDLRELLRAEAAPLRKLARRIPRRDS
jgi:hypothetical protein